MNLSEANAIQPENRWMSKQIGTEAWGEPMRCAIRIVNRDLDDSS
jgi:hypothetical protein